MFLQTLKCFAAGTGPTLIVMPDLGGRTFYMKQIILGIRQDINIWSLSARPTSTNSRSKISVQNLAKTFANQIMRSREISKPVFLVGHSFGGYLAYETAHVLLQQSSALGGVFLLDTAVPWRFRRDAVLQRILRKIDEVRVAVFALDRQDVREDGNP